MNVETLFQPGKNCWRLAHADRVALLIDGENFFSALHAAMRQARQSIIIVGWDVHSELQLLRNGNEEKYPVTLGKFLNYLAKKHKDLYIYLLRWDFAMRASGGYARRGS